jgi:hypothetical protein
MAILTHGSDLTLAPTVTPLVRTLDGTVQAAVAKLSESGFRAVQLDGTLAGIRPRDLSVRARKDLLALLTRRGLRLSGLDLFIPRKHFLESQHVDRAMAATLSAVELAADLGRVPLSIALPAKDVDAGVKSALVEAADGHGITLAVHAEDQLDALAAWVAGVDLPCLSIGLDAAALLGLSKSPVDTVHAHARALGAARLADVAQGGDGPGGSRCVLGQGELDVLQYRLALDLAKRRTGPVVLDLRGLDDPLRGAISAAKTWDDAAFTV